MTRSEGIQTSFKKNLDDVRDDITDSWSSEENARQADEVLDYLFSVQNDPSTSCSIVILSGDIHTSGYATLYSRAPSHSQGSIPPAGQPQFISPVTAMR